MLVSADQYWAPAGVLGNGGQENSIRLLTNNVVAFVILSAAICLHMHAPKNGYDMDVIYIIIVMGAGWAM